MKKLKLESLEVTSFETMTVEAEARGTVQGHADTSKATCQYPTYPVGFSIHIECNYVTSPLYNCTVDCTADCTRDFDCVIDGGELTA